MATIKQFEGLEIWKLARTLCQDVFEIANNNIELKNDYKLYNQINSSSGSVMDNIAEGLSETEIENLYNSYQLQKHLAEKQGHNCIEF